MPTINGQQYRMEVGKSYWFEYHCYEGHDSADAILWYHSHQKVKVLKMAYEGYGKSEKIRMMNGDPSVFTVKFADGYTWDAFEDEILLSKKEFQRPSPPLPRTMKKSLSPT